MGSPCAAPTLGVRRAQAGKSSTRVGKFIANPLQTVPSRLGVPSMSALGHKRTIERASVTSRFTP